MGLTAKGRATLRRLGRKRARANMRKGLHPITGAAGFKRKRVTRKRTYSRSRNQKKNTAYWNCIKTSQTGRGKGTKKGALSSYCSSQYGRKASSLPAIAPTVKSVGFVDDNTIIGEPVREAMAYDKVTDLKAIRKKPVVVDAAVVENEKTYNQMDEWMSKKFGSDWKNK